MRVARWPGIRHVRWLVLRRQLQRWVRLHGPQYPWVATTTAEQYLEAVWMGKA
jgi:hypothetical protein